MRDRRRLRLAPQPGRGRRTGRGGGAGQPGQTAPGGRGAAQLADGPGRDQVQATCTRCHGANLISNSWGYTKEGWQDRIGTMVALPPAALETISSYLAQHYPVKRTPGAVLISGPATVAIKEWSAPTLGSRPHDSHAAADGSIWWTGQYANKLGRLDPRTGQRREFDLPAGHMPHGLAEDPQGRSGTPRFRRASSAGSIRAADRFASTRSPSRVRAGRTRRSSTRAAATCSSRCNRGISDG